jgi:hypothetical protein
MLLRHCPLMHDTMPDLHLFCACLMNVSPVCLAIVCLVRQNYPNPPHFTYEFEHENGVLQ